MLSKFASLAWLHGIGTFFYNKVIKITLTFLNVKTFHLRICFPVFSDWLNTKKLQFHLQILFNYFITFICTVFNGNFIFIPHKETLLLILVISVNRSFFLCWRSTKPVQIVNSFWSLTRICASGRQVTAPFSMQTRSQKARENSIQSDVNTLWRIETEIVSKLDNLNAFIAKFDVSI